MPRVADATGSEPIWLPQESSTADWSAGESDAIDVRGTEMERRLHVMGTWYEVGDDGETAVNSRRFHMGTALVSQLAIADDSLTEAASRYASMAQPNRPAIDPKRLTLDDVSLLRKDGLYKPPPETAELLDKANALHDTARDALKTARRAEFDHRPAAARDAWAASEAAHHELWTLQKNFAEHAGSSAHLNQTLWQAGQYLADGALHGSVMALTFMAPVALSALTAQGLSMAGGVAGMAALGGTLSAAEQLRESAEQPAMNVQKRAMRALFDMASMAQMGLAVTAPLRFLRWLKNSAAADPSIEFAAQMLQSTGGRATAGFMASSGWSVANHVMSLCTYAAFGEPGHRPPAYSLREFFAAGFGGALSNETGHYMISAGIKRGYASLGASTLIGTAQAAIVGTLRETRDVLPVIANSVATHYGSRFLHAQLKSELLARIYAAPKNNPAYEIPRTPPLGTPALGSTNTRRSVVTSASVVNEIPLKAFQLKRVHNLKTPTDTSTALVSGDRTRIRTPVLVKAPMTSMIVSDLRKEMSFELRRRMGLPAYKTHAGYHAEQAVGAVLVRFRDATRRLHREHQNLDDWVLGSMLRLAEEIGPRGRRLPQMESCFAKGVVGPTHRTVGTMLEMIGTHSVNVRLDNAEQASALAAAIEKVVKTRYAEKGKALSQKDVDLAALRTILGATKEFPGEQHINHPTLVRNAMYLAGMRPSDAADLLDRMRAQKMYTWTDGNDPHGIHDLIHFSRFKMEETCTMEDLRDWVVKDGLANLLKRAMKKDGGNHRAAFQLKEAAERLGMIYVPESGGSFRAIEVGDPTYSRMLEHLLNDVRINAAFNRNRAQVNSTVLTWFLRLAPDADSLTRLVQKPFRRDNL